MRYRSLGLVILALALPCLHPRDAAASLDSCALRAVLSDVAASPMHPPAPALAQHLPPGVLGLSTAEHVEQMPTLDRAVQEFTTATRDAVARMIQEGVPAQEVETFIRARHREVKAYASQHNRSARIEGEGYEVIVMAPESYRFDTENGIHYLRPSERARYLVNIEGGVLRDANSAPVDTGGHAAIIVMDAEGNIYIMNEDMRSKGYETGYRHSSILGGGPTAFAGNVTVHGGRIVALTNRSGHYRTPASMFAQIRTEFREQGYAVPSTVIHEHVQDDPSL